MRKLLIAAAALAVAGFALPVTAPASAQTLVVKTGDDHHGMRHRHREHHKVIVVKHRRHRDHDHH